MDKAVYWTGQVGTYDDFDDEIIEDFIDGKTVYGSWAIMTLDSFLNYGVGLGTGLGQRYEKQRSGRWLKVEG